MNNLYNISLTTLSPIHIGTGDTLTSIGEYIATSASIKIVDQQALNKLFESHTGLRERFLFHIGEKQKNSNIFQFFKDEGLEQDISFTRTIPLHAKDFNTTSNNLLELLIDAGCGNYIPGSSLKGAFRSLFFAAAIMDDPSLKKKVSEIITSSELISKPNKKLTEQDILKQIRKQVEQLEDRLFQDDMTRFKVRDSGPFAGEDLCVEIAKREHLFGVDSTGLDVLRECIQTGAGTKVELAILPAMKNQQIGFLNNKKAIPEMFALINRVIFKYIEFETGLLKQSSSAAARDVIKELAYLNGLIKESKNEYAIIRIGRGKSFYFTVILSVLDAIVRNKILSLMNVENQVLNIFPRSRILNDENKMFGWIKLEHTSEPIIQKPLVNNRIEELVKDKTILKARCTGEKTVCLILNGIQLDNVQLVNRYKQPIEAGDDIEVLVVQITKEGKINQVLLITE